MDVSSPSEQDRMERAERMVIAAIDAYPAFDGYRSSFKVYAKGSYANSTNVRADSDVDIAVQCHEAEYWEEATEGAHTPSNPYTGIWTPENLRSAQ
jgi:tRNA nucleotidyltransferase (CCA-adding enzyme)